MYVYTYIRGKKKINAHTGDAHTRTFCFYTSFLFFLVRKTMARPIEKFIVDKIMQATNIVDVIGDYIQLRKKGVEYEGLCPFHDDKSLGSFKVSPSKGIYKCFSCEASGDAINFLENYGATRLSYPDALRYLAKKYSIVIPDDDEQQNARWQHVKPAQPRQIVEVRKELLVMPRDVVKATVDAERQQPSQFTYWLRQLPWYADQRRQLEQALWLYCVGRWYDRVVFWQIDEQGRPHTAKLMRYEPDGHRVKDKELGKPGWMHNQDGVRQHLDLDRYGAQPCVFGLHLLNRYPDAVVNIVESEKTALLMTAFQCQPERHLWMAVGGLQFLKPDMLQPLIDSGRRVWIWPDRDGQQKWRDKVGHLLNDRVSIYTEFFDRYWLPRDGEKADVADVELRLLLEPGSDREAKANYEARQRQHTGDGQTPTTLAGGGSSAPTPDPMKPADVTDEEWAEHLQTMQAIHDWQIVHPGDEPFIDPDELNDSFTRWARQRMRDSHTPREWPPIPTSKIEGIRAVGEIMKENPIIKKLFEI